MLRVCHERPVASGLTNWQVEMPITATYQLQITLLISPFWMEVSYLAVWNQDKGNRELRIG
ncbi:MAG: hypothetical protein U0V48_15505 [Anaerolineales bacterium]